MTYDYEQVTRPICQAWVYIWGLQFFTWSTIYCILPLYISHIRELAGVWHNQIDVVINWHSTTTRYYLTNAHIKILLSENCENRRTPNIVYKEVLKLFEYTVIY